jgi:hypothetical protein
MPNKKEKLPAKEILDKFQLIKVCKKLPLLTKRLSFVAAIAWSFWRQNALNSVV